MFGIISFVMLYFVLYLEAVVCFNVLFSQEFFEALLLVLTGYPVQIFT